MHISHDDWLSIAGSVLFFKAGDPSIRPLEISGGLPEITKLDFELPHHLLKPFGQPGQLFRTHVYLGAWVGHFIGGLIDFRDIFGDVACDRSIWARFKTCLTKYKSFTLAAISQREARQTADSKNSVLSHGTFGPSGASWSNPLRSISMNWPDVMSIFPAEASPRMLIISCKSYVKITGLYI